MRAATAFHHAPLTRTSTINSRLFMSTRTRTTTPSSTPNETRPPRLFPEEVNIIYDSKCNVCKLEIDYLAKRDSQKINIKSPKLRMTDLESSSYDPSDPANGRISYEEGMKAIHAVTADGRVIKGVPVFALAYEQVGLGWLFRATTWPIVRQLVEVGYTLFARYRTNITRGASVEALVEEYEAKREMARQMEEEKEKDCRVCQTKES